ncbi:MAG: hypothetical protein D6681_15460, partial [Calditrichaeota bacterium]
MTIHIHNPRIRELVQRMQRSAGADGSPTALDQSIWIEVSPETDSEKLFGKTGAPFSTAFLLVPYPDHLVEHHARVYEQLSR